MAFWVGPKSVWSARASLLCQQRSERGNPARTERNVMFSTKQWLYIACWKLLRYAKQPLLVPCVGLAVYLRLLFMYFNYERYGKPAVFSLLCFVCVYYITASFIVALAISSVPFILGYIDIFARFGYILTVIIFLMAVIVVIIPDYIRSSISINITKLVEQTKAELKGS